MKLLTDHDIYKITVDFLKDRGHDVVTAKELRLHQDLDEELLKKAMESGRILLTRDKDFGMLVFLKKELCPGVIFLRIMPFTIKEVHNELDKVLEKYTENYLRKVFCVIEPQRYRIRHI